MLPERLQGEIDPRCLAKLCGAVLRTAYGGEPDRKAAEKIPIPSRGQKPAPAFRMHSDAKLISGHA